MRVLWLVVGMTACAPEVESQMLGLGVDPEPAAGQGLAVLPGEEGGELRVDLGLDRARVDLTAPAGEVLVADSVTEFSDEQGRDGWSYGYLEPAAGGDVWEMPAFNAGGPDPGWYAAMGGVSWTMMDATTMHPNGVITTGGRQPVEQWAVRRWTSEVTGEVRVTGHFAKVSVDGESNGVAAYVYVDGELRWAWYLEGWDDVGVDYEKRLTVLEGSTVDFVLDPWEADDRSDRSTFTAQVWAPAP